MTTKKIPLFDILVAVEDGSHEKGDRYIAKVKKLAPQITVLARFDGPVEGVELIRIGVVN